MPMRSFYLWVWTGCVSGRLCYLRCPLLKLKWIATNRQIFMMVRPGISYNNIGEFLNLWIRFFNWSLSCKNSIFEGWGCIYYGAFHRQGTNVSLLRYTCSRTSIKWKGHCMFDFSINNTVRSPKNCRSLSFYTLWTCEERKTVFNLSIKGQTNLSPRCPLLGGSTALYIVLLFQ